MNRKRKILAMLVAMALVLNTAAAFATPSKTIVDMNDIGNYTTSTGIVPNASFIIYETQPTDPWTQDLAAVADLVKMGKAPIAFFDAQVQAAVAALLPAGTDLTTLQMNEFIPISALNYEAAYGDVTASFMFPTMYSSTQKLVAVAALYMQDAVTKVWTAEWFVFPAYASQGQVFVTFSAEYVMKLESGWGSLAILSK